MPELIETDFAKSLGNETFPTIANNSTDADHDLDIGASTSVWVSNGTLRRSVSCAAMTKRIDAAWAAGDDAGGLDTGTVANTTWYYLYLIYNPTTDVSDYLISTSASSPTLPSGFTYYRRIRNAAILTDGSANILEATWSSERIIFDSPITEHNLTSSFITTANVTVPPNWHWIGSFVFAGTINSYFEIKSLVDSNVIAGRTITEGTNSFNTALRLMSHGDIQVNSSSQISVTSSSATLQFINTYGVRE